MSNYKIFIYVFVFFLSTNFLAAQETQEQFNSNLKISIQGNEYSLELTENTQLIKRIQGSSNLLAKSAKNQTIAKHYSGQIIGEENSWYRLSKIANHWTGIVSMAGQSYIIDEYFDQSSTASFSQAKEILIAQKLAELDMGQALTCGAEHSLANKTSSANHVYEKITNKKIQHNDFLSDSEISVFEGNRLTAQQASLANICTQTVDGSCLLAEIEFVFDLDFQNAFSSLSVAESEATAIINMVEGFYLNDLEVKFDAITLEFLSSEVFSSTTDPGDLVDDMRSKKQAGSLDFVKNSRALLHLVTGRDFNGSTVGTAFLGVLCNSRGANVGNSQLLRGNGGPRTAVTALVVAHEIGHNFDASHDGEGNTCSGAFIMTPSVNSSSTGFSTCSIDSMLAEINSVSNKQLCFNFPSDVSITANATNPNEVNIGESIITDYAITIADSSFQQASSIIVNGSLVTGSGSYESVSLNGVTCTLENSATEYSCNLSDLTAPISLSVTSLVANTDFEQSHTVSVGDSDDIVDTNLANNTVLSSFSVSALPPTAVNNVQVITESVGGVDVVNISWQDNSNDEDGFIIQRSVNSSAFSELIQVGANVDTFTDSTVNAGETYAYRVVAFNAAGNASESNVASVTLGIAPSAVTGLTATSNSAGTSVSLSWVDNSDNEDGFILERSEGSGAFSELTQVASNSVSFTDSNVANSTSYAYRVTAFNTTGSSPVSNEASVTTPAVVVAPPPPPTSNDSGGGGSLSFYLITLFAFVYILKLIRFRRRYAYT